MVAADGAPVALEDLRTLPADRLALSLDPAAPGTILVRASAPADLAAQVPLGCYLHARAVTAAGSFPVRVLVVGTLSRPDGEGTP